jgi:hypothetical protein
MVRKNYPTEGCSAAAHLAGEDALIFSTTRHQKYPGNRLLKKDIKLQIFWKPQASVVHTDLILFAF